MVMPPRKGQAGWIVKAEKIEHRPLSGGFVTRYNGRGLIGFSILRTRRKVMAKSNFFAFMQNVRSEAAKVTWPTRKETLVTTGMVFVMVVVASVFFLLSDIAIRWFVGLLLGLGR
jgi:preprotein translocase subunit SecE